MTLTPYIQMRTLSSRWNPSKSLPNLSMQMLILCWWRNCSRKTNSPYRPGCWDTPLLCRVGSWAVTTPSPSPAERGIAENRLAQTENSETCLNGSCVPLPSLETVFLRLIFQCSAALHPRALELAFSKLCHPHNPPAIVRVQQAFIHSFLHSFPLNLFPKGP